VKRAENKRVDSVAQHEQAKFPLKGALVVYGFRGLREIGTHFGDMGLSDFTGLERATAADNCLPERTMADDLLREARAANRAIARCVGFVVIAFSASRADSSVGYVFLKREPSVRRISTCHVFPRFLTGMIFPFN
jgi:hypothetical protein